MPNAPNVDGLPPLVQFVFLACFMVVTLVAAFRGYAADKKKKDGEPSIAHLADMGAVRRLTDTNITLASDIIALKRAVEDLSHYTRNMSDMNDRLHDSFDSLIEAVDKNTAMSRKLLEVALENQQSKRG